MVDTGDLLSLSFKDWTPCSMYGAGSPDLDKATGCTQTRYSQQRHIPGVINYGMYSQQRHTPGVLGLVDRLCAISLAHVHDGMT